MPVKHFSTIAECEAELARLRQICWKCKGPSLNPSGGNVHFDAYEDMEIAAKRIFRQIDPTYHPGERTDTRPAPGVSVETWEILTQALAAISTMTDPQMSLFVAMLRGYGMAEAARFAKTDVREIAETYEELRRTRPDIIAILRVTGKLAQDFTPPNGRNPDGPSGGQTTSGEIGRG